jgi:hypothetical protein
VSSGRSRTHDDSGGGADGGEEQAARNLVQKTAAITPQRFEERCGEGIRDRRVTCTLGYCGGKLRHQRLDGVLPGELLGERGGGGPSDGRERELRIGNFVGGDSSTAAAPGSRRAPITLAPGARCSTRGPRCAPITSIEPSWSETRTWTLPSGPVRWLYAGALCGDVLQPEAGDERGEFSGREQLAIGLG